MADKSINQLPVSDGLTDDGLLVVYQNSETKSIRGNLIKQFAQQGIEAALAEAKASGEFDGEDGYTPVKGKDYFDGEDGEDAVSPTVAVSNITGGHRITITDKNGTKTVDVMDGTDGYTPVKGKDYTDGTNGVSPTVSVADITDGHRLTITDVNGSKTVDIMDGTDGNDGVSIQSIERTAGTGAAGTTDTYTITLTDGSTTAFQVYNGANGEGAGDMTSATYDPQGKAQDIFRYVDEAVKDKLSQDDLQAATDEALAQAKASGEFDGSVGPEGPQGPAGPAGATPQKGVDYWTEADRAQMVADTIAALPDASEVSY